MDNERVNLVFVMGKRIMHKGACQGEALIRDKKNEKPKLVKRYLYSIEKEPNMYGIYVLMWTGFVILGLYAKYRTGNVFCLICAAPLFFLDVWCIYELVKSLIELYHFKKLERKTILSGKKYPAKIIAYEVEPYMGYAINHYDENNPTHRLEGGISTVECKILYYLRVQFVHKGNTRNVRTPALVYNPLVVLKSTNCTVYALNGKFFVTDFDFRTDKKSEKIILKRIMKWDCL